MDDEKSMKHQDKVEDALKARREAWTAGRPESGLLNHKPGSQNRKKGYRRKGTRRG